MSENRIAFVARGPAVITGRHYKISWGKPAKGTFPFPFVPFLFSSFSLSLSLSPPPLSFTQAQAFLSLLFFLFVRALPSLPLCPPWFLSLWLSSCRLSVPFVHPGRYCQDTDFLRWPTIFLCRDSTLVLLAVRIPMAALFDLTIFLDSVPPCFLRGFFFFSLSGSSSCFLVQTTTVQPLVFCPTSSTSWSWSLSLSLAGTSFFLRNPFSKNGRMGAGFCVTKKGETLANDSTEKRGRKRGRRRQSYRGWLLNSEGKREGETRRGSEGK